MRTVRGCRGRIILHHLRRHLPLLAADRMRIESQRDSHVGVPQQRLRRLHVLAVSHRQRGKRVTEHVPANRLRDPWSFLAENEFAAVDVPRASSPVLIRAIASSSKCSPCKSLMRRVTLRRHSSRRSCRGGARYNSDQRTTFTPNLARRAGLHHRNFLALRYGRRHISNPSLLHLRASERKSGSHYRV